MLIKLGHIGFWAGLYATAALVCFWQLVGEAPTVYPLPPWDAMVVVLLTATAVYALDRVKIRDAWIDPADRLAQPARYQFLSANSVRVRCIAAGCLLLAGGLGARISTWAPLFMAAAVAGISLYALRPRGPRRRIKDVVWLKNLYVAIGMTGFAALVTVASTRAEGAAWLDLSRERVIRFTIAGVLLGVRIALDAAMCDIDDEQTDRRFGTQTLATTLGSSRVWVFTGVARLGLMAALLMCQPLTWTSRRAWCVSMLCGTAVLRVPKWSSLREPVDLRFVPEAILATGLLYAQRL